MSLGSRPFLFFEVGARRCRDRGVGVRADERCGRFGEPSLPEPFGGRGARPARPRMTGPVIPIGAAEPRGFGG